MLFLTCHGVLRMYIGVLVVTMGAMNDSVNVKTPCSI